MKKDRAVESLLLPGSKFVLNILAEGREKVRPLGWAYPLLCFFGSLQTGRSLFRLW